MPIKTGPSLDLADVYIDYPFEEVMFRRDRSTGSIYKKFYGQEESHNLVPSSNNLYRDALRAGSEISREEYLKGRAM